MTSSQRGNSFHFVQNTLRTFSGIAKKLCSHVIFVDNLIFRQANAGSERFLNLFFAFSTLIPGAETEIVRAGCFESCNEVYSD